MIRKMEVDKNGNAYHIYVINDDHDPHNPNSGLEIDLNNEQAVKFHQDFIENHEGYIQAYKYEKGEFKKRTLSEFQQIKPTGTSEELSKFGDPPQKILVK